MRLMLIGAVVAVLVAASAPAPTASTQVRVAVCHKTTSTTRPYTKIVVRTTAALRRHERHPADIVPAPAGACPRTVLTPSSGGTAIRTSLRGIVERPEPGDPDGSGQATIRLRKNQGQVCFRLSVEDIALPAVGAHIHRGNANVSGDVVVALRNPNAQGVASGCVRASRTTVNQILRNRGSFYVNVHTNAFPDGAVRGQLGPTAGVRFFIVDLRGANEVPPADPDGSGTAGVRMRQGNSEVCFTIAVRDILLPATGAHIHKAPEGQNGDVVIPFTAPGLSGTSSGCVSANTNLIQDILDNPDGYYVNVHNVQYPGGAVRGQLE
jgi:hypothetical protein